MRVAGLKFGTVRGARDHTQRMFGNSTPVRSTQTTIHPRLSEVVRRHLAEPYRRPLSAERVAAFEALRPRLGDGGQWVLDAGCGTAASAPVLRQRLGRPVLAVDKSAVRLARAPELGTDGGAVVRGDLVDLWSWAEQRGIRFAACYLLYPNPWPKPQQLMRRWYAHPVWPAILATTRYLEVRSNWPLYALECAQALELSGWTPLLDGVDPGAPELSPFERKYRASGHPLMVLRAQPT
jgi:tRNA G46 methylase TrmB